MDSPPLPIAAAAPRAVALRALVVEDDEVDRLAIRRAVREADPPGPVEVREVGTLASARAALAESRWDCVLVDRQLPDGDGLSLLEQDGASLGGAALVILTGLEDEELARTALRRGAQDYLIKGRIEGAALLRSLRYAVERKAFEERLRRSESNFRGLIEESPDAVCVLRDEVVIYANPTFLGLMGRPADQVLGVPLRALVHPKDAAMVAAALALPDGTRTVRPRFEIRLAAPVGWSILETWTRPIQFDERPALLFIGRDITRRKQLEEQVVFSSRMAAVGTLAAGVAHEINNPLGFVLGNVDFALKDLRELRAELAGQLPGTSTEQMEKRTATVIEALEDAVHGAHRVRNIVRDLKTLARPADNGECSVPLAQVVDWSIGVVRHEIHHRARLTRDFQASPVVLGNETKLGQVVMNLLINAAQAIPEGHADQNEIRVRIGETKDRLALLEISDTGVGIAPADRPRIFDPFFTTKPVGGGTGLGLAVCHGIVTALGGTISVDSAPGRGSTFRVSLPVAEVAAPALAAAAPSPASPPCRRARVLIVEDEQLVASSLCRGLSRRHEVTVALTAREALERLAGPARFDVILCDVMMPEMTGMDLYREVARRSPELAARIIFMSGGVFTEAAQRFLTAVPNLRLDKPMDLDTLTALIEERAAAVPGAGA